VEGGDVKGKVHIP